LGWVIHISAIALLSDSNTDLVSRALGTGPLLPTFFFLGYNARGGFMNILQALKKEQAHLAKKLEGVAAAIAALGGKRRGKAKRKMSAAARAKISATQKANWRKKRAEK
jgi:hypothetical protein